MAAAMPYQIEASAGDARYKDIPQLNVVSGGWKPLVSMIFFCFVFS